MLIAVENTIQALQAVVQERAEALIALATEQGFIFWVAAGTMMGGASTLREQGREEEGIAQLRQGLADWRGIGTELGVPQNLGYLAEACDELGQVEEGLSMLTEALAVVEKTGEGYWETELYRLKGELLLKARPERSRRDEGRRACPEPAEGMKDELSAEKCFQKAIEVARGQSAKSLELRAVMSLCRLWQEQGKKEEARQMLAEIYGWFSEGFDTVDLKEAKALLEGLS